MMTSEMWHQMTSGVIVRCVASYSIKAFYFHHHFTAVPFNGSWKGKGCMLAVAIVANAVLLSVWRKLFCLIWTWHECLLGCEAAVRRLSTWWAALKYTLRLNYSFWMATCILLASHCGKDFASCSSAFTGQHLSTTSFIPQIQTLHKSLNSLKTRLCSKIEYSG